MKVEQTQIEISNKEIDRKMEQQSYTFVLFNAWLQNLYFPSFWFFAGKCLCRKGVRGEACSNVTDNRFFPKLDYLLYEAEYQSGNYSLTSDLGAYDKYFTGRGYARITRKQYIDFTILVDVDSNYSLVLRYSNALGNVVVHVRGGNSSSCSAINRNISTSNLLPRGQGMSWRSHERFMLCSNNTYAIRLQGNDPAENFSIDIDSLVLVPQLTELRAYKNMSKLVDTCQTNFSTIQGGYASLSACRSITFSTMIELYNGSLGKLSAHYIA